MNDSTNTVIPVSPAPTYEELLKIIRTHNKAFVSSQSYLPYQTDKYPRKKLVILTCMDTRLVELLPAALGIHNGDVKMIKNAGGVLTGRFDSAVRALLIAILELKADNIMVSGHTDCGVNGMNPETVVSHLIERGVSIETIQQMEDQGLDVKGWFTGFNSPESGVRECVSMLRSHPLIPPDVSVSGFVIDVNTGELSEVCGLE